MGTENVIWLKILLIFDCISRKPVFLKIVKKRTIFLKKQY